MSVYELIMALKNMFVVRLVPMLLRALGHTLSYLYKLYMLALARNTCKSIVQSLATAITGEQWMTVNDLTIGLITVKATQPTRH